jgi:hypothetical protein
MKQNKDIMFRDNRVADDPDLLPSSGGQLIFSLLTPDF